MDRKKELQMIPLTHSQARHYTRKEKRRHRRKLQRVKYMFAILALLSLVCFGVLKRYPWVTGRMGWKILESLNFTDEQQERDTFLAGQGEASGYPPEILELLEKNPETFDFVQDYANREAYKTGKIELKDEYVAGEVPLLLQWDKRWGYNEYGQEMIALAGCGPTCMAMAYLYFTGDTAMSPREMAGYAYKNGYYTKEGTSWSLWTDGAAGLGLSGSEISLDENVMKAHLDQNELIICSMAPGDFTTAGHFILIRGYDENGFFVNDPNRRSNSEKQWDFETLRYQIKCLWALGDANLPFTAAPD